MTVILEIKCTNVLLLLGGVGGRGCIFLNKLHLEEKEGQIVSEVVPVVWLFKMDSVLVNSPP